MLRHGLAMIAVLACALPAHAQGPAPHARESGQRTGSTLADKFNQLREAVVGKPTPKPSARPRQQQQPYGSASKPLHSRTRGNYQQPRTAPNPAQQSAQHATTQRGGARPAQPRISTGNGHYLDSAPTAMQTPSARNVTRTTRPRTAPVQRAVDPFQNEALLDQVLEASNEPTEELAEETVDAEAYAAEEQADADAESMLAAEAEAALAEESEPAQSFATDEELEAGAEAEFTAPAMRPTTRRATETTVAGDSLALPDFPTSQSSRTTATRARSSNTASPRATVTRTTAPRATTPRATSAKTTRGPVEVVEAAPETTAEPDVVASDVLLTREGPALAVITKGPRTIAVGKGSTYTVSVSNAGGQAATDVVVVVAVPEWADVSNAKPSAGVTATPTTGSKSGGFEWRLSNLAARGTETMTLEIVPLRSAPLDLGVRWSCAQATSQTTIQVQEPKLEIALEGPQEVEFGKKDTYKLTLSNPGNGDAENVTIILYPMAPDEGEPATHKLGTLSAGDSKSVEVELTARQSGQVAIRVAAKADGGLQSETSELVTVRKAELKIDVNGPENQYAGAPVDYEIRVTNPGNSAAEQVVVNVALPSDAKCLSSSSEGKVDETTGQLVWDLGTMAAGQEQVLTFKCELAVAGSNRVEVDAQALGDLADSGYVVTEVEALADLVLEVVEPNGPIAVGKDAEYQVKVSNRGTKSAENIEIVALFSNGIEPLSVEGTRHEISPGRVMLSPITSLAAGQEMVFSIKARAEVSGNHHFRAELSCEPINCKLTQQETTLYYGGKSPRAVAKETPKEPTKAKVVAEKPQPAKASSKKADRR